MPLPKTIGAYKDIRNIFDKMLHANSAVTLRHDSEAKAIRWRQRAYYFRTLLRGINQEMGLLDPSSPYDSFVIQILPDENGIKRVVRVLLQPDDSFEVTFDSPDVEDAIEDFPDPVLTPSGDDPLLEDALSFVLNLRGKKDA